ncbi:sodium ion-translocating decarboxylase subunit beta [Klebsiella quasipneumoniae subsp. quasipneumoniae]
MSSCATPTSPCSPPVWARVSNKVGLEADGQNFLLMHAMGPNVAGVIGSAIAAGVMLKYVLAM